MRVLKKALYLVLTCAVLVGGVWMTCHCVSSAAHQRAVENGTCVHSHHE